MKSENGLLIFVSNLRFALAMVIFLLNVTFYCLISAENKRLDAILMVYTLTMSHG